MVPNLTPIPPPGLSLFPGYLATQPLTFIAASRDAWHEEVSYLISYATSAGKVGEAFLKLKEEGRDKVVFRTLKGQEVMRVTKKTHTWSSKGTEYHGLTTDGNELWAVQLKTGWDGSEYKLQLKQPTPLVSNISIENKIQGQDKAILINGHPAATFSRHEEWKHVKRRDIIHIAPGMDILLALGVNYIRQDKQTRETQDVMDIIETAGS